MAKFYFRGEWKRVPACWVGPLGRDGGRWLLHLVESAGVVALATVYHCAFAFDDHCAPSLRGGLLQ